MNDSSRPPASRPPSFMRRFAASNTTDPNVLVGLVCDENYWVRRQAVKNPATPAWILELLVRAGATPDLRGKGEPDPTLDGESLTKLVEGGPWARQLVAEHPNTPAPVLEVLKDQPSPALRLAVAGHANAPPTALASLCCDAGEEIRAAAAIHARRPTEIFELLVAAGASPDLRTATRPDTELDADQLRTLAGLGPWGRFLAARHPRCPLELLEEIATDLDWRVRSGLLDNPNTPAALLKHLLGAVAARELAVVRALSRPQASVATLESLSRHRNPEVRLAVARHPAVGPKLLGILACDGVKEVRRSVVDHPHTNRADVDLLVRAGSTADLMALSEPDPAIGQQELAELARRGLWARQLAVRHPNTSPDTLARLVCDAEPKIREWAAVHPNAPQETIRVLFRAGCSTDFQGFMPPDPNMPGEELRRLCALGPWAEWVVANHPNTPVDLLESLAENEDWQVRKTVARNPKAPAAVLTRLAQDSVPDVRRVAAERANLPDRVAHI